MIFSKDMNMKSINFIIDEIVYLVRKNKLIMCTLFISLTISILSILLLSSTMYNEVTGLFQETFRQRYYSLKIENYTELNLVLTSKKLPKVEHFEGIDTFYGYDQSKEVIHSNAKLALLFQEKFDYLNDTTIKNNLVMGSYFTEKELQEGAQGILVSKDIKIKFLSKSKIGDEIFFLGSKYYLKGVFSSSQTSNTCFIPAKSLLYKQVEPDYDFYITGTTVLFSQKLSEEQKQFLNQTLSFYKENQKEITSYYDEMVFDYYMTTVKYIFLIILLFLFCLANLIGMFRYMIGKNIYSYVVYKLLGIKNRFFVSLVYSQSLLLYNLSFLFGYLGFQKILPLFIRYDIGHKLSYQFIAIEYFVLLLLLILSLVPIVIKLIKTEPMDRVLWR